MGVSKMESDKKANLQDAFIITLELLLTLLLWVVLGLLILPLTVVWLPLISMRRVEQWFCEAYYGMVKMDSDAVFWMLDTPKNKSIINSVMVFHEMYSTQRLQKIITHKMVDAVNDKGERKYPNTVKYIHKLFLN